MANEEHLALLKKGVEDWNQWREKNPEIQPDLSAAKLDEEDLGGVNFMEADLHSCNLSRANLMGANLRFCNLSKANLSETYLSNTDFFEANLCEANLREAYLFEANLSRVNLNGAELQGVYLGQADLSGTYAIEANLMDADLRSAYLIGTNLSDANLQRANLSGADLQSADLRRANLAGANLVGARLLKTNFEDANLNGCSIYGISCWELNLLGAKQVNLAIAPTDEISDLKASRASAIAVDNLEIAQLIYLLLNHYTIRQVINGSSQIVLILGNFAAPERQEILNAIQERFRQHNYLPVAFDLDKSSNSRIAETISCLAKVSRFAIVDLTDAKNIYPQLKELVSALQQVPVQLLAASSSKEYAFSQDLEMYSWVLPIYRYQNLPELKVYLGENLIDILEAKADSIAKI